MLMTAKSCISGAPNKAAAELTALVKAAREAMVNAAKHSGATRVDVYVEVDPDLIGGVRVVVGDEVLDTSVKARLERMKSALLA